MPLWNIYHPENAFSDAEKKAIAEKVAGVYGAVMPRFYVNVFFHTLPKTSFYIGGEPVDDFVRISIDHIARTMEDPAQQERFLNTCTKLLAPFIADRGFRWELHVDETPFSLWTVSGLKPPLPNTPAEIKWRTENKPSPYQA
jgi:phenylpyruvate tautomerase PptA (4-oxalocrotonate tautomerase family)